ncbi:MAG: DNA repair exonuclease [Ruminococcaceae bacterium]|nr:DNA repair exonuclease [Oscillospiraceae bacterium]
MIRILHAADLHMDSPFEGLSSQQAALRRREQRGLLNRLAELAEENGAQLMLLSGDLLDSGDIYTETGAMLMTVLGKLGIPVFIAPGNHDYYSLRSPYARLQLPENVHIFTESRLRSVILEDLGVRVWGAAYTDRVCPPLLEGFSPTKEPDLLDVLCFHGELATPVSPYAPCTEEELALSGMDYVAMGHLHRFSGLRRAGDTCYAWPGCPEGRGFDETGEKGVILADVARGRCKLRFVPLGGRRYEILRVEAGEDALASVTAALPENTERDIYRIILCGENNGGVNLAALRAELESRFFALQLRDETRPCRELWEGTDENSLTGLFLRRMRSRLEGTEDDAERQRLLTALRCGIAALEGGEEP